MSVPFVKSPGSQAQVLQIHHSRQHIQLRADRVRNKVSIHEHGVGRTESGIGSEEHVRWCDGDVPGEFFALRLLLFFLGVQGLLDAVVALADGPFDLLFRCEVSYGAGWLYGGGFWT